MGAMGTNHLVRVGVATLLRQGEEILMLKRAADLKLCAGAWGPPGGRVEYGETPRAAAAREVLEEVGVTVDSATLASIGVTTTRDDGIQWITHLYTTTRWTGTLRNVEHRRHTDMQWHSLGNLPRAIMPCLSVWFRGGPDVEVPPGIITLPV